MQIRQRTRNALDHVGWMMDIYSIWDLLTKAAASYAGGWSLVASYNQFVSNIPPESWQAYKWSLAIFLFIFVSPYFTRKFRRDRFGSVLVKDKGGIVLPGFEFTLDRDALTEISPLKDRLMPAEKVD